LTAINARRGARRYPATLGNYYRGVKEVFDRSVKEMMSRRNLLKAGSSTTVARAARLMERKNVGALLAVDDGKLVGIFTERDIVFRVVAHGRDVATTRVADVMTRQPHTIGPHERFGLALLIMHDKGFRHLPVVDGGRIVGILSARRAMDPDLEEFVSEAERRKHLLASHAPRAGSTRAAR
jgi:CBS domain-containing protein